MPTAIGLDLGTTSVGWSVIDTDTAEIIDTGVYIFPLGVTAKENQSLTVVRTAARGTRRRNFRRLLRRKKLIQIWQNAALPMAAPTDFTAAAIYQLRELAIKEKIELDELFVILHQFCNRRGFKSNKKTQSTDTDTGTVKSAIAELQKEIQQAGKRTVGEYFYSLFKNPVNEDAPAERIRNRFISRDMYLHEFNLIWQTQKQYHPQLTDQLKEAIEKQAVFYQRPLKSKKHLILKCSYYPNKRCIHKSHPLAEAYRIFQDINNLEYTLPNQFSQKLSPDEREILAKELLFKSKKLSEKDVIKLLKIHKNAFLNYQDGIKGANFLTQLYAALPSKRALIEADLFETIQSEKEKAQKELFQLWKIVYDATDETWLQSYAEDKLNLPEEEAQAFAKISITGNYTRKSHPLAEAYRIFQDINNLEYTLPNQFPQKLSQDEREILAKELLFKSKKLSEKDVIKLLKIHKNAFLNYQDGIKGANFLTQLYAALPSKRALIEADLFETIQSEKEKAQKELFQLWKIVYDATDETWLQSYAEDKLNLPEEEAQAFAKITISGKYTRLSLKATQEILPYLQQGLRYDRAVQAAGLGHHSYNPETDDPDRTLTPLDIQAIQTEFQKKPLSPMVRRTVFATLRILRALLAKYPDKQIDTVRIEMARELKMTPQERNSLHKKNKLIEKRREDYKQFLLKIRKQTNISETDLLKYELWLELGLEEKPDTQEINKILQHKNIDEIEKDQEKLALWKEANRISPYSGNIISLDRLFSPEIEIEHIIPFSVCLDNSRANKTLCERDINQAKGNKTPYEYFKSIGQLTKFKERLAKFPKHALGKWQRMMQTPEETKQKSGFDGSQLPQTGWIAKLLLQILKRSFRHVTVSNGRLTALLRRHWGIHNILNLTQEITQTQTDDIASGNDNQKIPSAKKERDDHRHHAVDAIIIALTTPAILQKVSTMAADAEAKRQLLNENAKIKLKNFPLPSPNFVETVKQKMQTLLVAHHSRKKLLTKKNNKIAAPKQPVTTATGKIKFKQKFHIQRGVIGVRGELHEETVYGKIQDPNNNRKPRAVVRKPVIALAEKQVDLIVDKTIREIIQKEITKQGSFENFKEWLENPENKLFLPNKHHPDKPTPIRKVRIFADTDIENLIPLANQTKFVMPGSNFIIAIYQKKKAPYRDKKTLKWIDNDFQRDYITVSFFEAARKAKNKEPFVLPTKGDFQLYQTFRANEMVLLYYPEKGETIDILQHLTPEQIFKRLYRVWKFVQDGRINLLHHATGIKDDTALPPIIQRKNASTLHCLKVRVNLLGQIQPAPVQYFIQS